MDLGLSTSALPILKPFANMPLKSIKQQLVIGCLLYTSNAPSILDYLDEESQAHFDEVRTMLDSLNIPYVIDTNMAVSYTHLL